MFPPGSADTAPTVGLGLEPGEKNRIIFNAVSPCNYCTHKGPRFLLEKMLCDFAWAASLDKKSRVIMWASADIGFYFVVFHRFSHSSKVT
jgi:hypothetical protein